MALGSTQPLTEMSTKNLPGGRKWPAHNSDNLTAISEPTVQKISNLDVSQTYGPTQPVTGLDLTLPLYTRTFMSTS
jgi:hypothetical protein